MIIFVTYLGIFFYNGQCSCIIRERGLVV